MDEYDINMDSVILYNTQENKLFSNNGELLNGSLETTALGVPGYYVTSIGHWGFTLRSKDLMITYHKTKGLPHIEKYKVISEDSDMECPLVSVLDTALALDECQAMLECLRYIRGLEEFEVWIS